MNKKGVFAFEVIILIIAVGLLVLLFVLQSDAPEKLGHRQFLVQQSVDSVQLELYDLEQRGKHALYDSVALLAQSGGFSSDPSCGSITVGENSYNFWARRGSSVERCKPDLSTFDAVLRSELDKRKVSSELYDFYIDDHQLVGIASHFWQRVDPIGPAAEPLGLLEQYPKPSFRVAHNYPFEDYTTLQDMTLAIVTSCATIADESLVDCAENAAEAYEQDFSSLSIEKVAQSRVLTIEAEQSYQNLFTGPISISFAIGLELRVNQEAFNATLARVFDGTAEQLFTPETTLNTRLPEYVKISLPFEDYPEHRALISYDFLTNASLVDLAIYKDNVRNSITQRQISNIDAFLTSRGTDSVTYYLSDQKELFFVPIPLEEKTVQIEAVYADSEGERYVQLITLEFTQAQEDDVVEPSSSLYSDNDIIVLNPVYTDFLLIESLEAGTFAESSPAGWISTEEWSIEGDTLMRNGEEYFLPEIPPYYVFDTATEQDSFTVLYTVFEGEADVEAVIVQPNHVGTHEFYNDVAFIESSWFDDWEYIKQEAQFDYDVRQVPP